MSSPKRKPKAKRERPGKAVWIWPETVTLLDKLVRKVGLHATPAQVIHSALQRMAGK